MNVEKGAEETFGSGVQDAPYRPVQPQSVYVQSSGGILSRMGNFGCILILALLACVALVVGLILSSHMRSEFKVLPQVSNANSKNEDFVDIHPAIKLSTEQIEITNLDAFPYENLEITLNPDASLSGGFTKRLGTLEPKKTLHIGLLNFADEDGNRFNPFALKVKGVYLREVSKGKVGVAIR